MIGATLVAVSLVAGCDGDEPEPQASPTPTPSPVAEAPKCPLTGEQPPQGVDLDRPAVAVKIENSAAARPQSGLDKADLVFEEIVEGGYTRFMAIYHCGASTDAGPIRSARFDDPKIAEPFTRVIAYSGSNALVEAELRKRKMVSLNELNQRTAFYRVPPGTILVHNLFVRTPELLTDKRARKLAPPKEVFQFGEVQKAAKRARKVRLNFNKDINIEYRYKKRLWRRFEDGPFLTKGSKQIAVPNVLVQEVVVNNSRKLLDSAGNPSPRLKLRGRGRAFLFRDGKVIAGIWQTGDDGIPHYRTKKGSEFVFAPGPIWVELLPSKKGDVKGSLNYK